MAEVHPRTPNRPSLIHRFLDWLVLSHWRAINEEHLGRPTGPRSADFKAVVTIVVAGLVLTFMQYIVLRGQLQEAVSKQLPALVGSFWGAAGLLLEKYASLLRNITWSVGCAFFYFVIPGLVVRLVYRERLRDWGMRAKGYLRHLWIYGALYLLLVLPVIGVSFTPAFQQGYPFYKTANGLQDFLVWEAFYALQFLTLEFFFRGFMLHGLKEKLGATAILFMVVPYCMIHFQKPFLETTGAIIAGIALGVLSLRTRSVLGGATIHVAVAVTMDVAAVLHHGGFGAAH